MSNVEILEFQSAVTFGSKTITLTDSRPEILLAKTIEASKKLIEEVVQRTAEKTDEVRVQVWLVLADIEAKTPIIQLLKKSIAKDKAGAQFSLANDYETDLRNRGVSIETIQRGVKDLQEIADREPDTEVERLNASNPTENTVGILDEQTWWEGMAYAMQNRFHELGMLTCNKATPEFDAGRIRDSLSEITGEELEATLRAYAQLDPNVKNVEDPHIRRLCAALTASGLQTRYSCEGHGDLRPHVKILCPIEDAQALQKYINAHAHLLNEQWIIEIERGNQSLGYRLIANPTKPLSESYDSGLADLDVLGVLVYHAYLQKNKAAAQQA